MSAWARPSDPGDARSTRLRCAWPAADGGVNFAVFSEHATRVELCLFDAHWPRELRRYRRCTVCRRRGLARLPGRRRRRGWCTAAGPRPLRAPEQGHRFNAGTSCCWTLTPSDDRRPLRLACRAPRLPEPWATPTAPRSASTRATTRCGRLSRRRVARRPARGQTRRASAPRPLR
jgi:glycogen operon protein